MITAISAGDLRRQWIAAVAMGELLGFAVSGLGALIAWQLGFPDALLPFVLVPGGIAEGAILGAFQWRILRRVLPKLGMRSWVVVTAAAAGIAWVFGILPSQLYDTGVGNGVIIGLWFWAGCVFLVAMGAPQWLVLRRHADHSRPWIWWNAAAWPLGVVIPVAALSALPNDWPTVWFAVAGVVSGLAMGITVGLVTSIGFVQLVPKAAAQP